MSKEKPWEDVTDLLDAFEEKFYLAKACYHDDSEESVNESVYHWLVVARRDLNSAIEKLELMVNDEKHKKNL